MELPKMVWMKVDLENKELPLEIEDSAEELAKVCGVKVSSVIQLASKAKHGGVSCYRKVWIADV